MPTEEGEATEWGGSYVVLICWLGLNHNTWYAACLNFSHCATVLGLGLSDKEENIWLSDEQHSPQESYKSWASKD